MSSESETATNGDAAPLDATQFKELQIAKSGLSGLHIASKDGRQQFYIDTSLYSPSKKDITIHAGKDSKGKVLGDVDLKNFSGHYTVELGDPHVEPVRLEELDRVKGWSSRHQFEFEFAGRERDVFMWRHRGRDLSENRDDLELVLEDEEREEEDEVLAVYEAKGGEHGWKSKGRLLVKEGGGEKWELMVILTVLALIVSKRREQ
ncbi:hypothetical protein N431DRAFT_433056 [Stipitochalara longipes BDJ]|nr:hypothetical protein N431DRAFT_433056 [Stipitochalara longipes BDJ]